MPSVAPEARLFVLTESRAIADSVAQNAALAIAPLEDRRFEDGEFKLRPLESVRGHTTFVLQSLAGTVERPASERLLRLLFLLNVLRDDGATRRVALVPYLAFARKERRTQPRDPVNTRYVAQLLEISGADQLIALDVHNSAAIDNAFRIPTDHLTALPMMAHHFASCDSGAKVTVVSPDIGGIKRVQIFRELLESRLGREVEQAFIEKRRAQGIVSTGMLVGEVIGREVVVLDDLCSTGGTLMRAANICRRAGAKSVHVAVTHMLSAVGLMALLRSEDISTIITTDSIAAPLALPQTAGSLDKLVTLPIAPLFGQAVRRILARKPVTPLLTRWPVAFED